MTRATRLIFGFVAVGLGALGIAAFLTFTYEPMSTTFNVTIQTEWVSFVNTSKADSRIPLEDVEVWDYESMMDSSFTGAFEVGPQTTVVVERVSGGPLSIRITTDSSDSAGMFYVDDDPARAAGRFVEFLIPDVGARAEAGLGVLIPLAGDVIPGREISFETGATTAVLRAGTVSMLGRSIFSFLYGGDVFEAGRVELNVGDQFFVDEPQSSAHGFVLADERPALTAAYRIVGRKGRVVRPGPGGSSPEARMGYPVSVSLLDRVLHDRLFQALSVLFGSLMIIAGIGTFVMQVRREFRQHPSNAAGEVDYPPRAAGSFYTTNAPAAPERPNTSATRVETGTIRAPWRPGSDTGPVEQPYPPDEIPPASNRPDDARKKSNAEPEDQAADPPSSAAPKSVLGIAALLLLCLPSDSAAQELVFVRGSEEGWGVLRARMDECFVVVPNHVVENYAEEVLIVGPGGLRASGRVEAIYEPDLAVIRLHTTGGLDCDPWGTPENYDAVLDNHYSGFLETRDEDGASWVRPVNFRYKDGSFITVKPSDPSDEIRQTLSGSALFVSHEGRKTFMGMMLSLDAEDQSLGLVYQADDLARDIASFFPAGAPKMDVATAQGVLDRALQTRDGSMQGQVEAIESLVGHGHSFDRADLSGISLRRARLRGARLSGADFHATDLTEIDASAANLQTADFRFADLVQADLSSSMIQKADFPFIDGAGANFSQADAGGSVWFAALLPAARFERASLRGAVFGFSDLRDAVFDGADLSGAAFFGSDLRGASFTGATLDNTDFTGARIDPDVRTRDLRSGACRTDVPIVPQGAFAHVLRVAGIEPIPSSRFDGGYEYSPFSETQHLYLLPRLDLPLCRPRALPEVGWVPIWQSGGAEHLRDEVSFRMAHEVLRAVGRRQEVRSRIERHLERMYPFPSGPYQAAVSASTEAPELRAHAGIWTLEFLEDGALRLRRDGAEPSSARFERRPRYEILIQGESEYLGCDGTPATYRWHYSEEGDLRLRSYGEDRCTARQLVLASADWKSTKHE